MGNHSTRGSARGRNGEEDNEFARYETALRAPYFVLAEPLLQAVLNVCRSMSNDLI